jgi:hypothetical protein
MKAKKKTLKRVLKKSSESASYCCEAAETLSAVKLPKEDAFNFLVKR